MHGGLEEISLSFYDARSMTLSQIMINTPIVIAATAAARLSSPRAAFGTIRLQHKLPVMEVDIVQRDCQQPVEQKQDQLDDFNGRNCDG